MKDNQLNKKEIKAIKNGAKKNFGNMTRSDWDKLDLEAGNVSDISPQAKARIDKNLKKSFSHMSKKDWQEFDKAYREGEMEMDVAMYKDLKHW